MGRKPMTPEQRAKMRARILDAARDRFLEDGLDGLSMRGIASRVGVSSMTLYLYYESRQDIVRHIVSEGFALLNAKLEDGIATGGTKDKLENLSRAYLEFALENDRYYGAMFRYLTEDRENGPDELLAGPSTAALDVIAGVLTEGGLGADDARAKATTVWASLHGLAMLAIGGQLDSAQLDVAAATDAIATSAGALA